MLSKVVNVTEKQKQKHTQKVEYEEFLKQTLTEVMLKLSSCKYTFSDDTYQSYQIVKKNRVKLANISIDPRLMNKHYFHSGSSL